jgi:hypothetical protein
MLITSRAAAESVNFWREGFSGARTGSRGAVMASNTGMGSRPHYPGIKYQCYYRCGVENLRCNALLILPSAAILSLKFSPALLAIYPDHSSLPLTLYFYLLEFRPMKLVIRRTSYILFTANPLFHHS